MRDVQATARLLLRAQLIIALIGLLTVAVVVIIGLAGLGPFGHTTLPGR